MTSHLIVLRRNITLQSWDGPRSNLLISFICRTTTLVWTLALAPLEPVSLTRRETSRPWPRRISNYGSPNRATTYEPPIGPRSVSILADLCDFCRNNRRQIYGSASASVFAAS